MGQATSTTSTKAQAEASMVADEFVGKVSFTRQEILDLHNKFREIARSPDDEFEDMKIDRDEFFAKMKFGSQKIQEMIFRMIDEDNDGIGFSEFITALDAFHPATPIDKKIEMCFKVYDNDGGGSISRDEIKRIIENSLDKNDFIVIKDEVEKEEKMDILIDELFQQYETCNNNGEIEITRAGFTEMVKRSPAQVLAIFDLDVETILRGDKEE